MRAVVTVTGKDNKGIIAKVSGFLAQKKVNIEDISQTLLQDFFAMIMLVDLSETEESISTLSQECAALGKEIGMSIYVQHEDIFNAMHSI
jgi:ACT domain-containing protein